MLLLLCLKFLLVLEVLVATGIVTFIPINGDVDVLQPTDVIGISTEKLFVVNIDKFNSRVRVIREYDGTVGTAYTAGRFDY